MVPDKHVCLVFTGGEEEDQDARGRAGACTLQPNPRSRHNANWSCYFTKRRVLRCTPGGGANNSRGRVYHYCSVFEGHHALKQKKKKTSPTTITTTTTASASESESARAATTEYYNSGKPSSSSSFSLDCLGDFIFSFSILSRVLVQCFFGSGC